ncbi:MAG: sulfatase/phosphatase domain-containing protein, partial [Verrucomicrobiota bacterium]
AGTHVPFIAWWKGTIKAGTVSHQLIDFSDILPTLMEAAATPLPNGFVSDGRSFLPQLKGEEGNPRDSVFVHYEPRWGKFSRASDRFARNRDFKLYNDGRFFNVGLDPLENKALAGSPELDSRREQLQSVLDAMPPVQPPRPPASRPARNQKKEANGK